MLAPTHSIFGIFLTLSILAVFGIKTSLHWSVIAFTILGSLLPDIDLTRSFIGRVFPFISKPLERKFGHRTVTHSLVGWTTMTVLASLLLFCVMYLTSSFILHQTMLYSYFWRWMSAFSIGYFSHIFLDMLNPRGAQLFWPNKGRDVIPGNSRFRPEAGSQKEIIVFVVIFILMLFSFPISKYGISSSLRWILATPGSVMEEFKNLDTKLYIEFDGIFNQTKQPIKGTAEVLDVDAKRLVIRIDSTHPLTPSLDLGRGNEAIYTLSDEYSADIISSKTRFQNTKIPLKIETIEFHDETRASLLKRLPETALVSGEVLLPKGLELLPNTEPSQIQNRARTAVLDLNTSSFTPIEQRGDRLILNFASKKQIERLNMDESYDLKIQKDEAELKTLQAKIKKIQEEIKYLESGGIYTPYGWETVASEKEKLETQQKLTDLRLELQKDLVQIKELQFSLKQSRLVFSGVVRVRY